MQEISKNLFLLKIPKSSSLHQNNKFNLKCFSLKTSFQALFEVTSFCLNILDANSFNSQFQSCFPVLDVKKEREFKTILVKYLSNLKKDGLLPKDLMIVKSAFDNCKGERYISFNTVLNKSFLN